MKTECDFSVDGLKKKVYTAGNTEEEQVQIVNTLYYTMIEDSDLHLLGVRSLLNLGHLGDE